MRALVPVAIVAIIAVVVLVIWLTARSRGNRRRDVRALRTENDRLRRLVLDIETEARTQLAAGDAAFAYTVDLIRDRFIEKKGSLRS